MDYNSIKYYTDKFYLLLDDFSLDDFKYFESDTELDKRLAAYLHEYYHYLTNITTYSGIRQFNVSVPDYDRLITRLSFIGGIDAFPVHSNNDPNCKVEVDYWKDVKELMKLENYSDESHKYLNLDNYRVNRLLLRSHPMSCVVNGKTVQGTVNRCYAEIDSHMKPYDVYLSLYVIDEFLSSSIDRFLFENNLVDNYSILQKQSFYPYGLYDAICASYGLYPSNRDKILISYCALHSHNPGERLKEILEAISINKQDFNENSEAFLHQFIGGYFSQVQGLLDYQKQFIDECQQQHRRVLASVSTQLWNLSKKALSFLKRDYFFFVRPFMHTFEAQEDTLTMLALLKSIRDEMKEPLILQNKKLLNPQRDFYKDSLAILLAIYEVSDSLYEHRIAQRIYRNKYTYPIESQDNDLLTNIPIQPPIIETWHVALNELGLIKLYMPLICGK